MIYGETFQALDRDPSRSLEPRPSPCRPDPQVVREGNGTKTLLLAGADGKRASTTVHEDLSDAMLAAERAARTITLEALHRLGGASVKTNAEFTRWKKHAENELPRRMIETLLRLQISLDTQLQGYSHYNEVRDMVRDTHRRCHQVDPALHGGDHPGEAVNAKETILALAKDIEEETNAAFDLWTWLPSYKAAEEHHGDYAGNYRPSVADVLREASVYVHHLRHKLGEITLAPSTAEVEGLSTCPCGEDLSGIQVDEEEWRLGVDATCTALRLVQTSTERINGLEWVTLREDLARIDDRKKRELRGEILLKGVQIDHRLAAHVGAIVTAARGALAVDGFDKTPEWAELVRVVKAYQTWGEPGVDKLKAKL